MARLRKGWLSKRLREDGDEVDRWPAWMQKVAKAQEKRSTPRSKNEKPPHNRERQ